MSGVIPTPYDLKEANYSLPKYLEVGVINQPPLDLMEETILKVSEKEEKVLVLVKIEKKEGLKTNTKSYRYFSSLLKLKPHKKSAAFEGGATEQARYKNCQRQKIPLNTKKNKNNKKTPPQKVSAAVFVLLLNRYRPLKSQQTTEYLALTHLPRPLPTEGFLATAVFRSAFSSAARRRRRSWRRRQQVERCRKVLFRRGLVEVVVKSFNRNSRS